MVPTSTRVVTESMDRAFFGLLDPSYSADCKILPGRQVGYVHNEAVTRGHTDGLTEQ